MSNSNAMALSLSRAALRALIALNVVFGFLILVMLIGSFVAETWMMTALGAAHPDRGPNLYLGMRLIMVIGIAAVALAHIVLTRLMAIVETVRLGDPFAPENNDRLQVIAWMLLGMELLHGAVGAIARAVSTPAHPLDIDWNFSVTRSLAVLLLFVLARVFELGNSMRAELEATV